MKFIIHTGDLTQIKTDLLVVNIHDGKLQTHSFAHTLDQRLKGALKRLITQEKFKGEAADFRLLNTAGKLPARYVMLAGLGEEKKFDLEVARKIGAAIVAAAKKIHAQHVTTAAHGGHLEKFIKGECAQSVVEGMKLASYSFSRYKKSEKIPIKTVAVLCPTRAKIAEVKQGIAMGELLCEGVSLARDLINTPARDMTPIALANAARRHIKGARVRIFHAGAIKRMKMGAFLGVAQGSINPPTFIEIHYRPRAQPKSRVALVGKAVTFDSGGLSLKPAKSMETMKDDMSGAATVIGLMSVIRRLKPRIEVYGFAAAAENMPGHAAQRPGDIVRSASGKTIEVLNTDAEGRLTLADAIWYAVKKKPDYTIDIATLTGACLVALGQSYSAVMGNDQVLMDKIITAAKKSGEKVWQLPLEEEYKGELKSPIADLKNVGGNFGGTINGGLFIQEFVGKHKWAHLDIAGPSWSDKSSGYITVGGTGVMVRTLADFLLNL